MDWTQGFGVTVFSSIAFEFDVRLFCKQKTRGGGRVAPLLTWHYFLNLVSVRAFRPSLLFQGKMLQKILEVLYACYLTWSWSNCFIKSILYHFSLLISVLGRGCMLFQVIQIKRVISLFHSSRNGGATWLVGERTCLKYWV